MGQQDLTWGKVKRMTERVEVKQGCFFFLHSSESRIITGTHSHKRSPHCKFFAKRFNNNNDEIYFVRTTCIRLGYILCHPLRNP